MGTDSNDISADGKAVSPDALADWIALTRERYHCGDWANCISAAQEVNRLDPSNPEITLICSAAHMNMQQFPEATEAALRTLKILPDNPKVQLVYANCLAACRRFEEALEYARKSVEGDPSSIDAQQILGTCLMQVGFLSEAELLLTKLLNQNSCLVGPMNSLALVYLNLGQAERAIDLFRLSHKTAPYNLDAMSNLCFWLTFDQRATASEIFNLNRDWGRHLESKLEPTTFSPPTPRPDGRIRIAYVANDFYDQVTSWFMEPVLARHNRKIFHITCYSGTSQEDYMTERLSTMVDRWEKVPEENTKAIIDKIRSDGIDILIAASLYLGKHRRILASRVAPIQIGYNNRVSSTGLDTVDYMITEELSDPIGTVEPYYSETLVRISNHNTYLPPTESPEPGIPPCIENGYTTFGSFNNIAKINDFVIHVWARILNTVGNSRLLLRSTHSFDNKDICARFESNFADHGVSSDRLIFSGHRNSREAHLAAICDVDIALDPFPCNGGTTSCETLWMGVPLITMKGDTYMGRQGVHYLTKVGLPELICENADAYVEAATTIAGKFDRLVELRKNLRSTVKQSLFAYDQHVQELEIAYETIWQRYVDGLPPASFTVADSKVTTVNDNPSERAIK